LRIPALDLGQIIAAWTHCYHVTYEVNLASIRRWRALLPANTLFAQAAHGGGAERRTRDIVLRVRGEHVVVRNQCSLDPASLELEPGATVDDYVAYLNSRAYFWPGSLNGPVEDGTRMLARSGVHRSIVLRVPTRSLLVANPAQTPDVSTCNTGAAWTEAGRKSRRGAHVFRPCEAFTGAATDIVEISFMGTVGLPADTTYAAGVSGPWRALFR
jgi:uncharacterized protein DUF7002